jgi:hypothetical protein
MADYATDFAKSGFVNIMGGCCGNTPEHIAAIAKAVENLEPRRVPQPETIMRLSGSQPYNHTKEANFLMIGERTNVAGSPKFSKLIKEGQFEEAVIIARQQVENGANVIDICMDEGLIDGVPTMTKFLNLLQTEPEVAKVPFMVSPGSDQVFATIQRDGQMAALEAIGVPPLVALGMLDVVIVSGTSPECPFEDLFGIRHRVRWCPLPPCDWARIFGCYGVRQRHPPGQGQPSDGRNDGDSC